MMNQGKYRIIEFRDNVPHWLRFVVLLFTVITFQFSNCIYLANMNELMGDKTLSMEDLNYIQSAALVGLAMVFPILFRLKTRFKLKVILLTVSSVIIMGNIVNMYSSNLLVLVVSSLIIGLFKILGTFGCFSTIQLIMTPKRDLTVFFPVLYLVILGSIQLSGILTAEMSYMYGWEYMHITIIGMQLFVMSMLIILMKPIRAMKKMPLYQIDWLGMGLWIIALLSVNYVFEYGILLDWFHSEKICAASFTSIIVSVAAVMRMNRIRRPFILPGVFKDKKLLMVLLVFGFTEIFLSSSHTLMNQFTCGVLGYDLQNNASLNWAVFAGMALGSAFSFYWISKYRGSYKIIVFLSFLSLGLYHFILYFLFSPSVSKEALVLPYVLEGIGFLMLYVSLTSYVKDSVPFPHFFGSLSLMGIVHTATGGTVANTIVTHYYEILQKKNTALLSQGIDFANPISNMIYKNTYYGTLAGGGTAEQANSAAIGALYHNLYVQSFLASCKEMFGYIIILGLFVLLIISLFHFLKPVYRDFSKIKEIIGKIKIGTLLKA